jgi:NAD(P)-dependent dehydrogenase (short-subunit alcohol dehydrogenase family)
MTKRNILITGAAGNLGRATMEKFIQHGYQVIALVSRGKGMAQHEAIDIREVDLSDEETVNDVVENIFTDYPTIDALISLAGAYAGGNLEETSESLVKRMIAANFETAFYISKKVFHHMVQQSYGRIIFIGSKTGLDPSEGNYAVAYTLSKSMLVSLAALLNASGSKKNVVTHVIAPSIIDTPDNRRSMPDANFSNWIRLEEITDLIFSLSSPNSSLREGIFKMFGNA